MCYFVCMSILPSHIPLLCLVVEWVRRKCQFPRTWSYGSVPSSIWVVRIAQGFSARKSPLYIKTVGVQTAVCQGLLWRIRVMW